MSLTMQTLVRRLKRYGRRETFDEALDRVIDRARTRSRALLRHRFTCTDVALKRQADNGSELVGELLDALDAHRPGLGQELMALMYPLFETDAGLRAVEKLPRPAAPREGAHS